MTSLSDFKVTITYPYESRRGFEVIISAINSRDAELIAVRQYGGRARVSSRVSKKKMKTYESFCAEEYSKEFSNKIKKRYANNPEKMKSALSTMDANTKPTPAPTSVRKATPSLSATSSSTPKLLPSGNKTAAGKLMRGNPRMSAVNRAVQTARDKGSIVPTGQQRTTKEPIGRPRVSGPGVRQSTAITKYKSPYQDEKQAGQRPGTTRTNDTKPQDTKPTNDTKPQDDGDWGKPASEWERGSDLDAAKAERLRAKAEKDREQARRLRSKRRGERLNKLKNALKVQNAGVKTIAGKDEKGGEMNSTR